MTPQPRKLGAAAEAATGIVWDVVQDAEEVTPDETPTVSFEELEASVLTPEYREAHAARRFGGRAGVNAQHEINRQMYASRRAAAEPPAPEAEALSREDQVAQRTAELLTLSQADLEVEAEALDNAQGEPWANYENGEPLDGGETVDG